MEITMVPRIQIKMVIIMVQITVIIMVII